MRYMKLWFSIILLSLTLVSCAQQDNIIGVWEVKNNHYQAVYELVENEGKFYGKVHYYNDGTTEYKVDINKDEYFLTDVEAKDEQYVNGKMYLPDGSYYEVIFTKKDANTLIVKMTVNGELYSETWNRQSNLN